jgi:hypothetical protein
MYLNHFGYFNRLTQVICEEIEILPPEWRCPAPDEMAPAKWLQEIGHECTTLYKEVLVVTEEAKEIRKLVCTLSEHLSSHQTQGLC